jgi:hypothetical protein
VEELKKFTKPRFDLEDILATASELKYTRELKRVLAREFENPSDEFVRYFTKQVHSGIFNQTARERFTEFVSQAVKQFTNEIVSQRLQNALAQEEPPTRPAEIPKPEPEEELDPKREIHTTQEELEAYFIVKTILHEAIGPKRITMRDTLSYCGILFDDNNRKPVCRLHFNRVQKYFGIFDENKNETRYPIAEIEDVYKYADALKKVTLYYDKNG